MVAPSQGPQWQQLLHIRATQQKKKVESAVLSVLIWVNTRFRCVNAPLFNCYTYTDINQWSFWKYCNQQQLISRGWIISNGTFSNIHAHLSDPRSCCSQFFQSTHIKTSIRSVPPTIRCFQTDQQRVLQSMESNHPDHEWRAHSFN